MLPSQPGSVLCEGVGAQGSELIVESVTTFTTTYSTTAGALLLFLGPEETALNIAFLLVHGGRSANKIRTRLEGSGKKTSTLVLTDILELPSSGCN